MLFLTAIATFAIEAGVLMGLKKLFFKPKVCGTVEKIPFIHELSLKYAGNPTSMESKAIDKVIKGARKLVNTTTFEHLVSGAILHVRYKNDWKKLFSGVKQLW